MRQYTKSRVDRHEINKLSSEDKPVYLFKQLRLCVYRLTRGNTSYE